MTEPGHKYPKSMCKRHRIGNGAHFSVILRSAELLREEPGITGDSALILPGLKTTLFATGMRNALSMFTIP